MSHRSRRSDDRDNRSHKYDKYDRYEHRHRRDYDDYDDLRDRSDHYSSRSRHRSRSRSSSKSYSRHHRSRSKSSGHSYSRHHSDHHSRSHRSKDYRGSPDPKSHPRDYFQSKHGTASDSRADKKSKYETSNEINELDGQTSISLHQQNSNSNSGYDTGTNDEPKINSTALNEQDSELEEEKQRIQKETLERLQKHFEKEGKAYPPPKPQASHPIFANDGSFLEIFKKTIQQQQSSSSMTAVSSSSSVAATATAAAAVAAKESQIKPIIPAATTSNPVIPLLPVKRRGAKILKTGIVQKQRIVEEVEDPQPTDSWNSYLKEVKRYKTVTCSDDNITRSLVK